MLERLRLGVQRAQDFSSRGVALCVQNPVPAVRALVAKNQLRSLAVKLRSPCDQFLAPRRSFFHQNLDRLGITQTIPGTQRVLEVQSDFIFVAQSRCDPSLRRLGIGIGYLFFRQHQHPSRRRQFDGRAQTGHSRANHYIVGFGWHTFHRRKRVSLYQQTNAFCTLSLRYDGTACRK